MPERIIRGRQPEIEEAAALSGEDRKYFFRKCSKKRVDRRFSS